MLLALFKFVKIRVNVPGRLVPSKLEERSRKPLGEAWFKAINFIHRNWDE